MSDHDRAREITGILLREARANRGNLRYLFLADAMDSLGISRDYSGKHYHMQPEELLIARAIILDEQAPIADRCRLAIALWERGAIDGKDEDMVWFLLNHFHEILATNQTSGE